MTNLTNLALSLENSYEGGFYDDCKPEINNLTYRKVEKLSGKFLNIDSNISLSTFMSACVNLNYDWDLVRMSFKIN